MCGSESTGLAGANEILQLAVVTVLTRTEQASGQKETFASASSLVGPPHLMVSLTFPAFLFSSEDPLPVEKEKSLRSVRVGGETIT